MKFEDLLNHYLDGSLDETSEQTMFSAIAANDEYRKDFSDALRVRSAVHQETLAITVPEGLTNSVFSSLGYDIVESTSVSAGIPWWRSTLSGIKNSFPYILSSAAGAFVMWYLLSLSSNNNTISINTRQPSYGESASHHGTEQLPYQNETPTSLHHLQNSEQQDKTPVIIKHHYIYEKKHNVDKNQTETPAIENNNDLSIGSLPSENISIEITSPLIYKNEPFSINVSDNSFINNHTLPQLQLSDSENEFSNNNKNFLPVEFSIRSLQLRPQEQVNVAGNDGIGINNIAIALFYRLDSEWSIGIEGGREPFSQTYSIENDIAIENIRQFPTLWWGGLTGRYEGRSLLGKSVPFPTAVGATGLAETGAYFRGTLGIGWDIVPSVTMSVGAELAQLFYSVDQRSYKSTNFGWMYGFTIRF